MNKRITVTTERTQTALMLSAMILDKDRKKLKPLARSLGALLRLVQVKREG